MKSPPYPHIIQLHPGFGRNPSHRIIVFLVFFCFDFLVTSVPNRHTRPHPNPLYTYMDVITLYINTLTLTVGIVIFRCDVRVARATIAQCAVTSIAPIYSSFCRMRTSHLLIHLTRYCVVYTRQCISLLFAEIFLSLQLHTPTS